MEKSASPETELYTSPASHVPVVNAAMTTESAVAEPPVLEDVAEEEEVLAAAGSSASGCCQVSMWRRFTLH